MQETSNCGSVRDQYFHKKPGSIQGIDNHKNNLENSGNGRNAVKN